MRIRATRGVCIGVNKHLVLGQEEEVDQGTGQYLVSIGHERVIDAPQENPKESPTPSVRKELGKKEK